MKRPKNQPDMESLRHRAGVLIEALPYLRQFRGHTLVIKYGGAAMLDPGLRTEVLKDVVLLEHVGLHPVLVHGAGPEISDMMRRLGKQPEFVEGHRVSDAETVEIAQMVLTGKTNPDLVAAIHQQGGRAIGLSGKDGGMVLARKLGADRDLGFVGEVAQVTPGLVRGLISEGFIPVIAPIAAGAAGETFNVNSPKQLAQVLFGKLGLPPLKRTRTGYSTDQEVLAELAVAHRLPALVVEHRQLTKLLGTYVEALPRMVSRRTGRIHTSFNQTVTATGRLSSSDPNLQNIPVRTAVGREIRRAFVPARDGEVLLTADYSQIELRILAHLSQDQALTRSFRNDEDIHAAVASQVGGVGLQEVTPAMRRQAKAVNFGIIYGLSPFGLSRSIGVSLEQAQHFIEAYFARYPGVERFIGEVLRRAEADGFVTTLLGRWPRVGDTARYHNLGFTVTEMRGRRVGKIRVDLAESANQEKSGNHSSVQDI